MGFSNSHRLTDSKQLVKIPVLIRLISWSHCWQMLLGTYTETKSQHKATDIHTQLFYGSLDSVRGNLGESVQKTIHHSPTHTYFGHQSSLICFLHLNGNVTLLGQCLRTWCIRRCKPTRCRFVADTLSPGSQTMFFHVPQNHAGTQAAQTCGPFPALETSKTTTS